VSGVPGKSLQGGVGRDREGRVSLGWASGSWRSGCTCRGRSSPAGASPGKVSQGSVSVEELPLAWASRLLLSFPLGVGICQGGAETQRTTNSESRVAV
jgi:hypothetical protein